MILDDPGFNQLLSVECLVPDPTAFDLWLNKIDKTKQICLVKSNEWFRESNLFDEGEIRLSFAFSNSY